MPDDVPDATCEALFLSVCKSTDLAPRALPPVLLPSGIARISAPVPLGTSAAFIFVAGLVAVRLAVVAVLVVYASDHRPNTCVAAIRHREEVASYSIAAP